MCGQPASAGNLSILLELDEQQSTSDNYIPGEYIINNRITTALLLAAGTGSRLRPLTLDAPKCLTEVGGETILGRLVENLRSQGIERLVVVTGYLDHCVRDFLEINAPDMQLDYVFNPVYKTTNNIYSLWLARNSIDEPFVLVESDLVFDESMLTTMMVPDKIAISNMLPWMNGTVVELNADKVITAFHANHVDDARQYKTVNIYSLSLQSWHKMIAHLDNYISDGRVDEYYETVFAEMVAEDSLKFEAVFFDESRWYEIDTIQDLHQAELMFGSAPQLISTDIGGDSLAIDDQNFRARKTIKFTEADRPGHLSFHVPTENINVAPIQGKLQALDSNSVIVKQTKFDKSL